MLVVSYYTNEVYRAASEKLAVSLDRFSIPYLIESVTDRGSRLKNQQFKASYLLWKLTDLKRDIIWIDAKAVLQKTPLLLQDTACDIAAYKCGDYYWSGTVLVRNTPKAAETLRAWIAGHERNPDQSDPNFTAAVAEVNPLVRNLPPTYCWVTKTFEKVFKGDSPVIEHFPIEVS